MAKISSVLLLMLFLAVGLSENGSMGAGVFREYIGAQFNGVKFSDLPIIPGTHVDFILSFAIDYTPSGSSPTNGIFNIFWDTGNLSPSAVQAIKSKNKNVRVALSLGGDSVGEECSFDLITQLKQKKVISFASIAPFDDPKVQSHYSALWNKYGKSIDYVNFQFYAYDSSTTVPQFINYFNAQEKRYSVGKVLPSFTSDGSGGLSPAKGFFDACRTLKKSGKLHGIFVWSADTSKSNGFKYEKQAQALLH
ncbi:hypothetical protein SUGI_0032230 [Cryptomeria japonica]|nr:hypothetical protein SUGI_0032230 [Cryptomeria japonica]